jgi:hypothetical protein
MSVRPAECVRCEYRAHARDKLRRLGADVDSLHAHRERLERILALALVVATGGARVEPTALLVVLEEIDAAVVVGHERVELALKALRETEPARAATRRAA